MNESLLHAIDLAILGEWEAAKEELRAIDGDLSARLTELVIGQQAFESERARLNAKTRHEIGNALAIARANIEGMADGVLDVTEDRLNGIAAALTIAGTLLTETGTVGDERVAERDGHAQTMPVAKLVEDQVSMVSRIAAAKNVSVENLVRAREFVFQGDVQHVGRVLRNLLLNAVRCTPPGGSVRLLSYDPENDLTLAIEHPKRDIKSADSMPIAQAVAPNSHVLDASPQSITLLVQFA